MARDAQKYAGCWYCDNILISANNLDSRVINGYFIKISNLNVPYIT